METVYSYQAIPKGLKAGVLAIGNYDGVHRGHQIILDRVKKLAAEKDCPAGIMCFDPHPREFFMPDRPHFYLSSQARKLKLFKHFGMDMSLVLAFNRELSSLTAEEFVTRILHQGLDVSHVVIGYNFYFGKARQGTPDTMIEYGRKFGFDVTVIEEQKDSEKSFSSTRIRDLLRTGQVRNAAELLGYWWRAEGTVIHGANKGTGLGFPTANINLLPGQDLGHGIYASYVYIDGQRYMGAAYMGQRPTFDNGEPVLEVFLLDYSDDLYGKHIEVEFIDFIRPDQKFDDLESLKKQMETDIKEVRQILTSPDTASKHILSI